MKNIATKTLLLLAAALTIASTADAQIIKRNKPKKLSVKAQLAIERQRTDSLSSLVDVNFSSIILAKILKHPEYVENILLVKD